MGWLRLRLRLDGFALGAGVVARHLGPWVVIHSIGRSFLWLYDFGFEALESDGYFLAMEGHGVLIRTCRLLKGVSGSWRLVKA